MKNRGIKFAKKALQNRPRRFSVIWMLPNFLTICALIFGLIRFGSRVDIYFPSEVSVMVLKGQKIIAGETIIGDFSKNAKPVKEVSDEK